MIQNRLRTVFDLAKYVRVCPELLASGIFPKVWAQVCPQQRRVPQVTTVAIMVFTCIAEKTAPRPGRNQAGSGGWGGGCVPNCNMYTGSEYWSVFQSSSKTIRYHFKIDDIWIRWFGNVKNSKVLSMFRIRWFVFASADLKINPLICFLNPLIWVRGFPSPPPTHRWIGHRIYAQPNPTRTSPNRVDRHPQAFPGWPWPQIACIYST